MSDSLKQHVIDALKIDEGEVKVNGKHVVYKDHLGYDTLGYGRLVDRRKGGGLSDKEANYLLNNDVNERIESMQSRFPHFSRLNEPRQAALINMSFQLGVAGVLGFKKMVAAIGEGKFNKAADEALDSLWAKQTPNRAKRISNQIRTGLYQ